MRSPALSLWHTLGEQFTSDVLRLKQLERAPDGHTVVLYLEDCAPLHKPLRAGASMSPVRTGAQGPLAGSMATSSFEARASKPSLE